MRHLIAVLAIAALCLASTAFAEVREDNPDNVLTKVMVINGYEGTLALDDLEEPYAAIARAYGFEDASYSVAVGTKTGVLRIGIQVPGLAQGVELESVENRSDCPNNSVFTVKSLLANRGKVLDSVTEAWTRKRHEAPIAPLKGIVRGGRTETGTGRYDVRLDLSPQVSRIDAPQIE